MEIRLVDPRDDTRWEMSTRDYSVVFWKWLPAPVGMPQEKMAWAGEENELIGARDLHELIRWADDEARGAAVSTRSGRASTAAMLLGSSGSPGPIQTRHPEVFERYPPDVNPLQDE
jgi:hypothetical protein